MSTATKLALALICNLVIVVSTILVIRSFCKTEEGIYRWSYGAWRFKFFTTLSNVLAAVTALIMVPVEIVALFKGSGIPNLALGLKYIGTVVVTLTFLTVLFYLGPTQGYKEMFSGVSFYTHFLGGAIALFSFCVLEEGNLSMIWIIFAMIPMTLYALMYKHMVLDKGPLNGGWEDFYGFNVHDRWKISACIMLVLMLVINIIVMVMHNK